MEIHRWRAGEESLGVSKASPQGTTQKGKMPSPQVLGITVTQGRQAECHLELVCLLLKKAGGAGQPALLCFAPFCVGARRSCGPSVAAQGLCMACLAPGPLLEVAPLPERGS